MPSRPCLEQRTKLLKEFVPKKMIGNFFPAGRITRQGLFKDEIAFIMKYFSSFLQIDPKYTHSLFERPSVHLAVNSRNCRPQSEISCALRILSTASEVPWDVMHKRTRTIVSHTFAPSRKER